MKKPHRRLPKQAAHKVIGPPTSATGPVLRRSRRTKASGQTNIPLALETDSPNLPTNDWSNPAELDALVALAPKVSQLLHIKPKPQPFPCGDLRFESLKWFYPSEEATRTREFTGAHWLAWKPFCDPSFAKALEDLFMTSQRGVPITTQSLECLHSLVLNLSSPSVEDQILQTLITWQATIDEANDILQARSNAMDQQIASSSQDLANMMPQQEFIAQTTAATPPEAVPAPTPLQPEASAPIIMHPLEAPTIPVATLQQTEHALEPAASPTIILPPPTAVSATPPSATIISQPPATATAIATPPAAVILPPPANVTATSIIPLIPPASATATLPQTAQAAPLSNPAENAQHLSLQQNPLEAEMLASNLEELISDINGNPVPVKLSLSPAEKLECGALYDNIISWANKRGAETQKPIGLWMSAIESTFSMRDIATNHWNLFQKWVKALWHLQEEPKVAKDAFYEGSPTTDATSPSILDKNRPVMETHRDYGIEVRKTYSRFKNQCPDLVEWEQIAEADIRRHHILEVSGDPYAGSRRLKQLADQIRDLGGQYGSQHLHALSFIFSSDPLDPFAGPNAQVVTGDERLHEVIEEGDLKIRLRLLLKELETRTSSLELKKRASGFDMGDSNIFPLTIWNADAQDPQLDPPPAPLYTMTTAKAYKASSTSGPIKTVPIPKDVMKIMDAALAGISFDLSSCSRAAENIPDQYWKLFLYLFITKDPLDTHPQMVHVMQNMARVLGHIHIDDIRKIVCRYFWIAQGLLQQNPVPDKSARWTDIHSLLFRAHCQFVNWPKDFPLPVDPHISSARSSELQRFIAAILSPQDRLQLRRVSASGDTVPMSIPLHNIDVDQDSDQPMNNTQDEETSNESEIQQSQVLIQQTDGTLWTRLALDNYAAKFARPILQKPGGKASAAKRKRSQATAEQVENFEKVLSDDLCSSVEDEPPSSKRQRMGDA